MSTGTPDTGQTTPQIKNFIGGMEKKNRAEREVGSLKKYRNILKLPHLLFSRQRE